jgi:hypothetical protein
MTLQSDDRVRAVYQGAVAEGFTRWRYPHMCRDEHAEIGHADSSSEMCPLCREKARAHAAEAALSTLQAAVRDYFETFDGERGDESQAAFLGAEERLRALVPDAEEGTKP